MNRHIKKVHSILFLSLMVPLTGLFAQEEPSNPSNSPSEIEKKYTPQELLTRFFSEKLLHQDPTSEQHKEAYRELRDYASNYVKYFEVTKPLNSKKLEKSNDDQISLAFCKGILNSEYFFAALNSVGIEIQKSDASELGEWAKLMLLPYATELPLEEKSQETDAYKKGMQAASAFLFHIYSWVTDETTPNTFKKLSTEFIKLQRYLGVRPFMFNQKAQHVSPPNDKERVDSPAALALAGFQAGLATIKTAAEQDSTMAPQKKIMICGLITLTECISELPQALYENRSKAQMHKIGAAFRQWSDRLIAQFKVDYAEKHNLKGPEGAFRERLIRPYRSGLSIVPSNPQVRTAEYVSLKINEFSQALKKIEAKTPRATQAFEALQALTLKDLSEIEFEQRAEPALRDIEEFRQAVLEAQSITFEDLIPEEFMQSQDPLIKKKIDGVAIGIKNLKAISCDEFAPEKIKKECYEKIKNRRQK